jgi:DNA-binding CsgD family transcriptional regulator
MLSIRNKLMPGDGAGHLMHDPVLGEMQDFARWNDLIAAVIGSIGTEMFPDRLEAALHFLAPFQMMNGFQYSSDGRAFDLYNERSVVERRIIVDQYLAGAYILDPFYDAIRSNRQERLIVMRDLAPDDFLQSEYHRRHYASTSITDEVGFVLKLEEDRTAVLSLCRIGVTDPFSKREIRCFGAVAGIICRLGERHWTDGRLAVSARADPRPAPTIDHPLLTPREREIVMLILKGHSSVSIAMVLSLSPDTVKAHRRHIYAKLNISSQAELFHMFLIDHRFT